MKQPKKVDDFNIGGDHVNIKTSTIVRMNEGFTLITEEGPVHLDVQIVADFAEIPPKYHEVFSNMLTSKYLNKVSFSANPFSECKQTTQKKWWELWK